MVVREGEDHESKSFPKAPQLAGCDDPTRHLVLFRINLAPVGGIGGLLLQG